MLKLWLDEYLLFYIEGRLEEHRRAASVAAANFAVASGAAAAGLPDLPFLMIDDSNAGAKIITAANGENEDDFDWTMGFLSEAATQAIKQPSAGGLMVPEDLFLAPPSTGGGK